MIPLINHDSSEVVIIYPDMMSPVDVSFKTKLGKSSESRNLRDDVRSLSKVRHLKETFLGMMPLSNHHFSGEIMKQSQCKLRTLTPNSCNKMRKFQISKSLFMSNPPLPDDVCTCFQQCAMCIPQMPHHDIILSLHQSTSPHC